MFEEEKLTEEQREERARERARRGLADLKRILEGGPEEEKEKDIFERVFEHEVFFAVWLTVTGIIAFSFAGCWAAGMGLLASMAVAPEKARLALQLGLWLAWVPAVFSMSGLFSLDREKPSGALTVAAFLVSVGASVAIINHYILPWMLSLLPPM
ncbi:hypothetical protein PTH_2472 [Pelotomaculum thermopropionicum SI]|uniref:Uncharacterized protein n=1 Tax=Pelotomaculum thermopropionicum (strain DSM 13744 / JCM 10971 / SI) TaxID=370438 RepID=A5CZC2_PELTS|nr:hypothetical protein PTH_2472 [Pelotomaculum thermopropionicum SI]